MIQVEYILYFYSFLCLSLVLFSVFYMIRDFYHKKIESSENLKWEKIVEEHLFTFKENKGLSKKQIHFLKRKFNHTNNLLYYNRVIMSLNEEDYELYCANILETLQILAKLFLKKEDMEKAYFASCLINFKGILNNRSIIETLLSYLDGTSVYCVENTLNALYSTGNIDAVKQSFEYLNRLQVFHHYKLLSDGLLRFNGDKIALGEKLYPYLDVWNENLVQAILIFLRFTSGSYQEQFMLKLKKEVLPLDTKMEMLRYFRAHPYPLLKELLYEYIVYYEKYGVEVAALSCSLLESYYDDKSVEILKNALKNPNWYVRKNAATALVKYNLDEKQNQEILEHEDRYAREIFSYALEQNRGGKR